MLKLIYKLSRGGAEEWQKENRFIKVHFYRLVKNYNILVHNGVPRVHLILDFWFCFP